MFVETIRPHERNHKMKNSLKTLNEKQLMIYKIVRAEFYRLIKEDGLEENHDTLESAMDYAADEINMDDEDYEAVMMCI